MSHQYPVTWKEFYRDACALSWRLKELHPWKGIIAITRGGLVPAAIIARELGVRKIDTISVVSYGDDDHKQADLHVIKECHVEDGGAGWLIVDDLVDTGLTAKIVRQMLPKAHISTIYAKPLGISYIDTFMTEVSQDTWIIFPWEEDR